jgi:hypothetical protein
MEKLAPGAEDFRFDRIGSCEAAFGLTGSGLDLPRCRWIADRSGCSPQRKGAELPDLGRVFSRAKPTRMREGSRSGFWMDPVDPGLRSPPTRLRLCWLRGWSIGSGAARRLFLLLGVVVGLAVPRKTRVARLVASLRRMQSVATR